MLDTVWSEIGIKTVQQRSGKQQKLYQQYIERFQLEKYLKSTRCILVTGTNGKSTSAKLLYRYLSKYSNRACGLFISPHILSPNERIQYRGRLITTSEVQNIWNKLRPFCVKNNSIFFSNVFFLALLAFKKADVTNLVIECGIGAKNDITVNLPNKIGVITSVDFDHKLLLGNTLEKIAKNKEAVLKICGTLYIAEFRPKLLKIYSDYARHQHGRLINVGSQFSVSATDKMRVQHDNSNLDYQKTNIMLAAQLLSSIDNNVSVRTITNRLQTLSFSQYYYYWEAKNKRFYFSTAHNPAAVANTMLKFQQVKYSQYVIFSALRTKNFVEMIAIIKSKRIPFIIVKNDSNLSIGKSDVSIVNQAYFLPLRKMLESDAEAVLVIGTTRLIKILFDFIQNF